MRAIENPMRYGFGGARFSSVIASDHGAANGHAVEMVIACVEMAIACVEMMIACVEMVIAFVEMVIASVEMNPAAVEMVIVCIAVFAVSLMPGAAEVEGGLKGQQRHKKGRHWLVATVPPHA